MAQNASPCTPGFSNEFGACIPCSGTMTSDGGDGPCYCNAGSIQFLGIYC